MIIKSMGRKATGKTSDLGGRGTGGSGGVFSRLVAYMTRVDDHEAAESVIWHGFYGHAGMPTQVILDEFQRNATRLKERKNGNVLYHEILSFSKGYSLPEHELVRSVTDIGQEYLRQRATDQLAFGAVHRDTDHIHLHLMISANEVGKSERVRLSKKDFADIQKSVETYTLQHYPELAQTRVYDKTRSSERLKTVTHEQAMKARTGAQSQKEVLKAQLHQLFERARSQEDLKSLLRDARMTTYTRGKNLGVVVRDADGQERKHRFSTLGLDAHYLATVERFGQGRADPPLSRDQEDNMKPKNPAGNIPKDWTDTGPSAVEIVESEFITGKLHPEWHGDGRAEVPTENQPYTDSVLRDIERKKHSPSRDQAKPFLDRGDDER